MSSEYGMMERRSSDVLSQGSSTTNNNAATNMATANAIGWPVDVDLDVWYQAERAEVEDVIKDALDLSVWSLEVKKQNTNVYLHCKNNEKLSYSVRAVSRVTGTVANVLECLRAPDSASFRAFTKLLHSRVFLDSEVLHSHQMMNTESESLALKWFALSTGKKTLGKGKEFCVREYCTILRDHRQYGTVGVCKFESYDGIGARYGIRARPDSYGLTVFEPSSFVVCPTAEDGILTVTLTFSMRKARGSNSVSSGVKALSMRLAQDMNHFQRAMQHTMFQPATLADKREWVNDHERSNCSLCVQTFSMIKRRHHCRVCGEVVCSSCTVFKAAGGQDSSKIRVCKACLGKSSSTDQYVNNNQTGNRAPSPVPALPTFKSSNNLQLQTGGSSPYANNAPVSMPNFKNITLSTVSTSSGTSNSSDESRRSGDEADPVPPLQSMPAYKSSISSMYSKGSSSSFSDYEGSGTSSLSPRGLKSNNQSSMQLLPSSRSKADKRTHYFNDDFEEICMLAMETLGCAMAGIRTDDFELVNYFNGTPQPDLPRSLPTFRRIASRGKPCIVLDVSADKRISGEKRTTAKLQFFVGIPLIMDGEVIGDLCVADRHSRESIDYKAVEVLMVLGKTVTQYMTSRDYIEDLAYFKATQRQKRELEDGVVVANEAAIKEVAF